MLREILRDNPDVTRQSARDLGLVCDRRPGRESRLAPARSTRASMFGPGRSGCSAIPDAAGTGHGGAIRGAGQDRPQPESQAEPGLGLARLPLQTRWAVAEPLASHKEDASDRDAPA